MLAAYEQDRPIPEVLARKAAEAGNREGMTVYGLGLANRGLFTQAEHWLRKAMDAGDPLAAAALGTLCVEQGEVVRGMGYLRTAEAVQGPLGARLALIQVWARRTVAFDDAARADGVPDPALPPSPSAPGRTAVRAGRSAADWAELRQVLRPHPDTDDPEIIPAMLIMRAPEGDMAEAEAWFAAAARLAEPLTTDSVRMTPEIWAELQRILNPDGDVEPQVGKAMGALGARAGDLAGAEAWFAAAARGGDRDALLFRAEVHAEQHGMDSAAEYFRQAAKAGHPAAQHTVGVQAMKRGENREAEQYFRRAADAGHIDSLLNLGVLLRQRDDLDGAEECYRKAIDAGEVADGMNNLGNLLWQRGDTAGAEECWHVAADSGSGAALASLGKLHTDRGEWAEAEALFRRSADAGDTAGMLNLAALLKRDGRFREATRWLRAVSDIPQTSTVPPRSSEPTVPRQEAVLTLGADTEPGTSHALDPVSEWLSVPAERGDAAAQAAFRLIQQTNDTPPSGSPPDSPTTPSDSD